MRRVNDKEKEFIDRINKHQGILNKICFVYSRGCDDKEDLYQEIILQLWKSYDSFKGLSQFSTWMYKVALNTALTFNKKSFLKFEDTDNVSTNIDLNKSFEVSEDIKILYKAISMLDNAEKAIILLWLEEVPYIDIAKTVGLSEKNVSVKLVRIKKKLAELIEKFQ